MSAKDPGLRKIKAIVKQRDGIFVGKWDMRKPSSFQVESVKPPDKDWIRVVALYNAYPNCVRYIWFEKYGEIGKPLGCPTADYYGEDTPVKETA